MSDIEKPQNEVRSENSSVEKPNPQNTSDEDVKKYEERIKYFTDDLTTKLDEAHVTASFTVIVDPKSPSPLMIARGGNYELSVLAVNLAKIFKNRLDKDLSV